MSATICRIRPAFVVVLSGFLSLNGVSRQMVIIILFVVVAGVECARFLPNEPGIVSYARRGQRRHQNGTYEAGPGLYQGEDAERCKYKDQGGYADKCQCSIDYFARTEPSSVSDILSHTPHLRQCIALVAMAVAQQGGCCSISKDLYCSCRKVQFQTKMILK